MAKPYDATTKKLLELDPAGWLRCVGLPITGPVRAVDSDLSTVTAEADTILQVGEPPDYLAHLEIQTAHDLTLARRLLHYNVLLNYRHDRPVRSVAILLNRKADSPSLTGHHRVLLPEGPCYLDFRYSVVRVWKLDVEQVLRGGPAILPLAPLAKVGKKEVPSVIRRMKGRLEREVPEDQAGLLWTSTKVLMGLKYSRELIETLLRGVQGMKESVTYQAILEEGWAPGEQRLLLQMGRKRFGEPSPEVIKRVEAITEESILWKLGERLLDVSTWDELLSIL